MEEHRANVLIPVASADDPRLGDYANVKDAQRIRARGVFLAEGVEVVRTLIHRGRYPVRSLLLSEKRVVLLSGALEVLPPEVPVFVAQESVLNEIVGFDLHRGCLAAAEYGVELGAEAVLDRLGEGPRTLLVAHALANHDNVGGLFRNAAALGADAVLLDRKCADPLYRKAIRTSMGHVLHFPWARIEPGEAGLELLHARGFVTAALTPRADAVRLQDWLRRPDAVPPRVAFLVGTEGEGLGAETLAGAKVAISIEMAEGIDSLNVATAAAIALFTARAARE